MYLPQLEVAGGSFQDELRRLFSSDHKTEQLCETIRKGIIEQYEVSFSPSLWKHVMVHFPVEYL